MQLPNQLIHEMKSPGYKLSALFITRHWASVAIAH